MSPIKDWLGNVTTDGESVSVTVGLPDDPVPIEQDYEMVPVDRITTHPDNARRGNIEVIRESIRTNGFYGACVVQRSTSHILVGNHRYLAAVEEGLAEVPVVWVDKSDEEARRLLLVDNRTTDLAVYDDQALVELLSNYADDNGGLVGTGWDDAELAALIKIVEEETVAESGDEGPSFDLSSLPDVTIADPKVLPESGTKWRLGPHLLVVVDDMMKDWQLWTGELNEGDWFVPYPGPFMPMCAPESPRLVFVQSDRYLAGLVIDRWNSLNPAAELVGP
jgi:hypothetical protein